MELRKMSSFQYYQVMAHNDDDEIFLPEGLVKLALKIAQTFRLRSFDEFSLLDTLQHGLNTTLKSSNGHKIDEREMCLIIVSIMRLSEKFNNTNSEFKKLKLNNLFIKLGVTNEKFKNQEFATFKIMGFQIKSPTVAETIYVFIEKHLENYNKLDFLLEFSFDILRIAYTFKSQIFDA